MRQPIHGGTQPSSPPYPYGASVVTLVPPRCSTAHVLIAWVLTVLSGFYLLPWAVAATRGKRNVAAIALITIFLGWTAVGWIAALVMACLNDDRPAAVVINPPPFAYPLPSRSPGPYPHPALAPHRSIPAHSPLTAVAPASAPTAAQDEPTRPLDLSHDPYASRRG